MSIVGKTVTYWESETVERPAIITDANTGGDPLLFILEFGSESLGYALTAPQATEPTSGCWTEVE